MWEEFEEYLGGRSSAGSWSSTLVTPIVISPIDEEDTENVKRSDVVLVHKEEQEKQCANQKRKTVTLIIDDEVESDVECHDISDNDSKSKSENSQYSLLDCIKDKVNMGSETSQKRHRKKPLKYVDEQEYDLNPNSDTGHTNTGLDVQETKHKRKRRHCRNTDKKVEGINETGNHLKSKSKKVQSNHESGELLDDLKDEVHMTSGCRPAVNSRKRKQRHIDMNIDPLEKLNNNMKSKPDSDLTVPRSLIDHIKNKVKMTTGEQQPTHRKKRHRIDTTKHSGHKKGSALDNNTCWKDMEEGWSEEEDSDYRDSQENSDDQYASDVWQVYEVSDELPDVDEDELEPVDQSCEEENHSMWTEFEAYLSSGKPSS